jgi:hypothetical protein
MASALPIDSAADRRNGDFGGSPFYRQLSGALTLPDFTGRSSYPNSKTYFVEMLPIALGRYAAMSAICSLRAQSGGFLFVRCADHSGKSLNSRLNATFRHGWPPSPTRKELSNAPPDSFCQRDKSPIVMISGLAHCALRRWKSRHGQPCNAKLRSCIASG